MEDHSRKIIDLFLFSNARSYSRNTDMMIRRGLERHIMRARIYGVSPSPMARVIRAANEHSGGLRPGQPRNSVIGDRGYLETLLELAAEEFGVVRTHAH